MRRSHKKKSRKKRANCRKMSRQVYLHLLFKIYRAQKKVYLHLLFKIYWAQKHGEAVGFAVIWASSSADWRALTSQPKEIDCKAYSQQRENLTPSQNEKRQLCNTSTKRNPGKKQQNIRLWRADYNQKKYIFSPVKKNKYFQSIFSYVLGEIWVAELQLH